MAQGVGARRRRAGVVAAGVCAAVLVVSACTPEPEPDPTSSTSSPTTPTTSTSEPTPTETVVAPPDKPAEMERTDEVGAVAAAAYFMDVYSYVKQTGDLTEWDSFSGDTCGFCDNVRGVVEDVYGAGDRLVGGGVEVRDGVVVATDDQLAIYAVQFAYTTAPSTRLDSSGDETATYAGESSWIVLNVGPTAVGWELLGGNQIEEAIE